MEAMQDEIDDATHFMKCLLAQQESNSLQSIAQVNL